MQKLVWQNANGVELDLTSGNYGITEWEGFSNASLNIQQQQVPFQDGGVFLDALIEQRELSVTLAIQDNNNLELRYQQRRELISALNPKLGEGYLIYTNDFISKRIKCVPQIPLFETHNSDTVGTPKASLTWTACSPYWEDFEEKSVTFGQEEQVTITNNGDVKTAIQVDFFQTGEIENPKVRNVTEKKEVQYEGTLANYLRIVTTVGEKNVTTEQIVINAIPINNFIMDIKHCMGLYIACGQYGSILTSQDSENWVYQKSNVSATLNTIAFIKTKGIIVIGGGNCYLTSIDGVNWKVHTGSYFGKLFYDEVTDTLYGISGNKIFRTTDAENWEVVYTYIGTGNLKNILLRDNNGLVTITENYMITSTDGENWIETQIQGFLNSPKDMLFRNNIYIAVGLNGIGKSSDGVNWTITSMSGYDTRCIVYWENEQKYIICSRNNPLLESSDGDTWSVISNTSYGYKVLAKDDNLFITYNRITKYDSQSQSQIVYKNYSYANKSIVFQKNKIIIVGGSLSPAEEKIYYSENELQTITEYASGNMKSLTGICASEKIIVACGTGGTIITSQDGKAWSIQDSHTTNYLSSVCYSKKLKMFLAVGSNGTIIKSYDGINWILVDSGFNVLLSCVCYSEKQERFVIVGTNFSAISTDGDTWESGDTISASNIDYSDDLDIYIAGGSNKTIYKSKNGLNWEVVEILYREITSVKYIKEYGYFIIGCYMSNIYISSDGINWSDNIGLNEESTNITSIVFYPKEDKVFFIGDRFLYSELLDIESVINKLSVESDLNIGLDVGENIFYIHSASGTFNARIKYRQKYIGV